MLDTKGQWRSEFPTAEDDEKWFFVKFDDERFPDSKRIWFAEIRKAKDGELYLAKECNDRGIIQRSYGQRLKLYSKKHTQFCGPIQMPPNYRESGKEEIPCGAIYQMEGTTIFVKLIAETDGNGGNFGLEYWEIESLERQNYVGGSSYTMNRADIEQNSNWKRVK